VQGNAPSGSLASWEPASGRWLDASGMSEDLFGQSEPFSGRWPVSGSMRNGSCCPRPKSGRRTGGNGSSSWPGLLPTPVVRDEVLARNGLEPALLKTPTAQLAVNGGSQHPDKRRSGGHGPTLADQVEHQLLPTPRCADGLNENMETTRARLDGGARKRRTLEEAMALLPTPAARDGKGQDMPGRTGGPSLPGLLLPTPRATDGTKGGPNQRGIVGGPDAPLSGDAPAADPDGSGRGPAEPGHAARGSDPGRCAPADSAGIGRESGSGSGDRRSAAIGVEAVAEDGDSGDPAIAWGIYEPAVRRWEAILGRPAPRPAEPGRTGERLSPRFVEFMMGLPDGWVTGVPGLSRNQQLEALGNGVVPQQGAYALELLLSAWRQAVAA
jgi:hypothetical protein